MQCREVQERLSAYLDNELDSTLLRGLADHLNRCDTCRQQLQGLRDLDGMVKALPKHRMPPEFAENLVLRVCKQAMASRVSASGQVGLLGKVWRLVESFFELLESPKSPRTWTLDEFYDFPPFSIGYVYCKLLRQCRGK